MHPKSIDPAATQELLDKIDAEERLIDYITLMWSVLEPGREFVTGWAVDALCEHLEAVTNGQIRHLLINVPPGCMKSLTTQVFWPTWEWGPQNRPWTRYVSASYSEDLTIRDNRRSKQLIQSDLYQRLWGDRVILEADSQGKKRFDNTQKGFRIATSVGGLGTGERGDRFIIDDPHNVKESESDAKRDSVLQWFTEVVPSRINDPEKSAFVVIMQRVHERDVSGLILAEELGYEHLCLPMEFEKDHPHKTTTYFVDPRTEDGELLWPQRFSERHIEKELKPSLRAWGGEYAEAGQLQQRPVPRGGGLFKKDDLQFVEPGTVPPGCRRVRGWDLASSKDRQAAFTVGAKLALAPDGRIFIEHVRRGRMTPGEVDVAIKNCATGDGLDVIQDLPQDPGQAGKAQVAHFAKLLQGFTFRSSPESGSKEDRANPLAAQAEAGNLYLVRAPWNDAFVAEATTFPRGTYKDQVDAVSRAYARLLQHRAPASFGAAPEIVTG